MSVFFNANSSFSVYLYVAIVLFFFIAALDVSRRSQLPTFFDFFKRACDRTRRVTFALLFATLLGTPVTAGFFFKLSVFNLIACKSSVIIASACLINLILTIFYLQTVRVSQTARKKRVDASNDRVNVNQKSFLIFTTAMSLAAFIVIPALNDIASVFFL